MVAKALPCAQPMNCSLDFSAADRYRAGLLQTFPSRLEPRDALGFRRKQHMGGGQDENDKKRPPSSSSISPPSKKPTMPTSSEEKKVDSSMVQYQNQKLSQQLEVQRQEILELESLCKGFQTQQAGLLETLCAVRTRWKDLCLEMESVLSSSLTSRENDNAAKSLLPYSPGAQLSQRLKATANVEEPETLDKLDSRSVAVGQVLDALDSECVELDDVKRVLRNRALGAGPPFQRTMEMMKVSRSSLSSSISSQQFFHTQLLLSRDICLLDKCQTARISGQLSTAEENLSTAKAKLSLLKKPATHPSKLLRNSNTSTAKPDVLRKQRDTSSDISEAESSLDDYQKLVASRLQEVGMAERCCSSLQQQRESGSQDGPPPSPSLNLLSKQSSGLRHELQQGKSFVDAFQRERDVALSCEKEMRQKADAANLIQQSYQSMEKRQREIDTSLRKCLNEFHGMQILLENEVHSAGRKETVEELKVMVSTLNKEMEMMQSQLDRYLGKASEVDALREDANALSSMLLRKMKDGEDLSEVIQGARAHLKSLQEKVEDLKWKEHELKLIAHMWEQEESDARGLSELRESELLASSHIQTLKSVRDEHSLELRVKAAREAEEACQGRLSAAEGEMVELRVQLDNSERLVVELKEMLCSKEEDGEAYITGIETIGHAYEEMQAQNRRLLEQISERDDFNTQLMAESVKAKQLNISGTSELEGASSKARSAASAAETYRMRALKLEDQLKTVLGSLSATMGQNRSLLACRDELKQHQVQSDQDLAIALVKMECVRGGLEDLDARIDDAKIELEKERSRRKRLEDNVSKLRYKTSKMASIEKQVSLEKLQEQVREHMTMLKCSVCHDRPKEVVITKCYHLFCGPCIQRNLEIRHRKCPGCGVPFGQSDVRNVNMA